LFSGNVPSFFMDVGGNVNEYSQVIIWWEGNINCKILFSWIVHDNGFQQHSWCMKEWTQRQGTTDWGIWQYGCDVVQVGQKHLRWWWQGMRS
jgi:hypothetical protein